LFPFLKQDTADFASDTRYEYKKHPPIHE